MIVLCKDLEITRKISKSTETFSEFDILDIGSITGTTSCVKGRIKDRIKVSLLEMYPDARSSIDGDFTFLVAENASGVLLTGPYNAAALPCPPFCNPKITKSNPCV